MVDSLLPNRGAAPVQGADRMLVLLAFVSFHAMKDQVLYRQLGQRIEQQRAALAWCRPTLLRSGHRPADESALRRRHRPHCRLDAADGLAGARVIPPPVRCAGRTQRQARSRPETSTAARTDGPPAQSQAAIRQRNARSGTCTPGARTMRPAHCAGLIVREQAAKKKTCRRGGVTLYCLDWQMYKALDTTFFLTWPVPSRYTATRKKHLGTLKNSLSNSRGE